MVGRSRVRFPMESLGLLIDNPSGRTTDQRPTHPGNGNEYQKYQLWEGVLTTDITTTLVLCSSINAQGLKLPEALRACPGL